MIRYCIFQVWHAAIAYFEVALVANFSELEAGIAKMFVNQSQGLFADVCAFVLAETWIKPYNIPRFALLWIALLLGRFVGYVGGMAALSQCILESWFGLFKVFAISRNIGYSGFDRFGQLLYNAARVV